MIVARETIYAALFSQLTSALGATFKTYSRRWADPSQGSPADRPCLFQVETGEHAIRPTVNGMPTKWQSTIDLVMYTTGSSDGNSIPSTELNTLLDAVENAIKAITPGLNQTLGGKVTYCRIEGKIEVVENVSGTMALAVIPVSLEILG